MLKRAATEMNRSPRKLLDDMLFKIAPKEAFEEAMMNLAKTVLEESPEEVLRKYGEDYLEYKDQIPRENWTTASTLLAVMFEGPLSFKAYASIMIDRIIIPMARNIKNLEKSLETLSTAMANNSREENAQ